MHFSHALKIYCFIREILKVLYNRCALRALVAFRSVYGFLNMFPVALCRILRQKKGAHFRHVHRCDVWRGLILSTFHLDGQLKSATYADGTCETIKR